MLLSRGKLRDISMNIECDCPFYDKTEETINHMFINCELLYNIWSTINYYCPNLTSMNLHIIDWLELFGHIRTSITNSFVIHLKKLPPLWAI